MTHPTPARAQTTPAVRAAFDEHRPPSAEIIADCVHCGFCLPTCPTYLLWGEEMDSPRGRIVLMKAAVEHEIPLSATAVRHFDQCLGCMACVTACPSGVRYDRLIEATRAQVERRYERSAADRLMRAAMFAVFPYPRRLKALTPALWVYRKSGLHRLLRTPRAQRLTPARMRSLLDLAPPVSAHSITARYPARVPARGERRMRVGLALGCVQRVFFPSVNDATVRVLAAEGCEVEMPR
ncbi:MAG TPA: 4Fe-4S dicluster domain-containing protein, partial [Ktedonobacterales bacterium]|nr:4Fe-4S dicluster domain-containing protein [Ktedonobacterales bacterium]